MIKLLGIVIVAAGFAFRVNTLAAVLGAGILTGLLAGFSFNEIMAMTGRFFVDNRSLTLPVLLMIPVVGLLERHGLQERVAFLMSRMRAATAGRVLWLYQVIREVTSMFGLGIGNHASMVRPLVVPMAEGAERARAGSISEEQKEAIRSSAAAAENVGNFFADDIFVAIGALLLIRGFLESSGVPVDLGELKKWSVPTALWVIALGWWRCWVLDRWLARRSRAARQIADSQDKEGGP